MNDQEQAVEPNLEQLVATYIKIRDAKEAKEEELKGQISELSEQLRMVSDHILQICQEQNADSVRTKFGTVSRRVNTRYWTSDWESMYQFIEEHNAPFLLEKRIHNGAMKEFLQENPDVMPMGLQTDSQYSVVIYKPRKS